MGFNYTYVSFADGTQYIGTDFGQEFVLICILFYIRCCCSADAVCKTRESNRRRLAYVTMNNIINITILIDGMCFEHKRTLRQM